MTDFGVHCVGKIHGSGIHRKSYHTTLWSEDKYFLLLQITLEIRHELIRIRNIRLPINDAIEPVGISRISSLFVRKVSRHSPFGTLMHLFGTNLHFKRFATRTNHCGVQ